MNPIGSILKSRPGRTLTAFAMVASMAFIALTSSIERTHAQDNQLQLLPTGTVSKAMLKSMCGSGGGGQWFEGSGWFACKFADGTVIECSQGPSGVECILQTPAISPTRTGTTTVNPAGPPVSTAARAVTTNDGFGPDKTLKELKDAGYTCYAEGSMHYCSKDGSPSYVCESGKCTSLKVTDPRSRFALLSGLNAVTLRALFVR
ncbi:hypothetical protein AYO38_02630 [bacterium SCGC AG-212-C10]|nr:hypothetical protein AYO38_02630 [bacterium SCGC AG-212-C10]